VLIDPKRNGATAADENQRLEAVGMITGVASSNMGAGCADQDRRFRQVIQEITKHGGVVRYRDRTVRGFRGKPMSRQIESQCAIARARK
jgi:hypothetical protein